jgi:hypothetical protein
VTADQADIAKLDEFLARKGEEPSPFSTSEWTQFTAVMNEKYGDWKLLYVLHPNDIDGRL